MASPEPTPTCVIPEDQVSGWVVVVVQPTGCADVATAEAYGPHGEMEAHDLASLAVRSGRPAFMVDLTDLTVERYGDTDAG